MGAVNFSIDLNLVSTLKKFIPFEIFVETGTFNGDTIELVKDSFPEIYSIEISSEHYKKACIRFAGYPHIRLIEGNSATTLSNLFNTKLIHKSVLFFLDAHWCVAEDHSGLQSQCPLLEEIISIRNLNEKSMILIDDARLFTSSPLEPHNIDNWPLFSEIISALNKLSDQHDLMIINDVITFYPKKIQDTMRDYSRKHGIDWLRAHQSLSENYNLRNILEGKETVIQSLSQAVEYSKEQHQILTHSLQEKETVIQSLSQAVEHSKEQHHLLIKTLQEQQDVVLNFNQMYESLSIYKNLSKNLDEKEKVIKELSKALVAYRSFFSIFQRAIYPIKWLLSMISSAKANAKIHITPRLGNLNQHAPRKLALPSHYYKTTHLSKTPKISIVTPSFKQAYFIERTIKSVLDQSYPNLEYYIQDGNSQDGTKEILEQYNDALAGWESIPDNGQSNAINLAFCKTTGDIMAWINSDDILLPGSLNYIAEYFNQHPEIDVVYGHRILIDENDQQIGRWIMPPHDNDILSWVDYIPQETLFWRRHIWDKAGGKIEESFGFAMDWDLLVRFRNAGARFACLPRFLGGFRIHSSQKTTAAISEIGFQEMGRIRKQSLGYLPSDIEIRKAVFPYLLRHTFADMSWGINNILKINKLS